MIVKPIELSGILDYNKIIIIIIHVHFEHDIMKVYRDGQN